MVLKLQNTLKTLFYNSFLYNSSLKRETVQVFPEIPFDLWSGEKNHGESFLLKLKLIDKGKIFYCHSFPEEEIFWYPETDDPRWFSLLHSFEWLRDLRTLYHNDSARLFTRELVMSWLNWNTFWNEYTWSPSLLSQRIVWWVSSRDFFWASADNTFQYCIQDSIARQTTHLKRVVASEKDPKVLLLLIKGLAYGGLCLKNRAPIHGLVNRLLKKILPVLLFKDGGCRERSAQKQFFLLLHLFDIYQTFLSTKVEIPQYLQDTLTKMIEILYLFRHGDKGLAFFNEGQKEDPNVLKNIFQYVSTQKTHLLSGLPHMFAPETRFDRLVGGKTVVIMDTGPPPVDPFDTQAHAGTLSFEMSYSHNRVIVNCGVYAVFPFESRSTVAHSTLSIDNTNSSEVLKQGGIGDRRAEVQRQYSENDDFQEILTLHNGYLSKYGLIHQRRLRLTKNGQKLSGIDTLLLPSNISAPPEQRVLQAILRFHLSPEVFPVILDPHTMILHVADDPWEFSIAETTLTLEESLYSGNPSQQIVISQNTTPSGGSFSWNLQLLKTENKILKVNVVN